MRFTATPLTAALAGLFSALAWPFLWPLFHDTTTSGTVQLVAGMLFFIALPAHAFVVGLKKSEAKGLDTALLKRIGAWLLAAAVTSAVLALRS